MDFDEICTALSAESISAQTATCGFFLCTRGEGRLFYNGLKYEVLPGTLCVLTPYSTARWEGCSPDFTGIRQLVDYAWIMEPLKILRTEDRLRIRNAPCVTILENEADNLKSLAGILNGADNIYANHSVAAIVESRNRSLLMTLCMEVLLAYFNSVPASTIPQSRNDIIFNSFLTCLIENCPCERSLTFFADRQSLSPHYFSAIIKDKSGHSVMEWIEGFTIAHIKHMLLCSELSIKEIAAAMKFPDQSTLGRYFKRYEGVSPQNYRTLNIRKL